VTQLGPPLNSHPYGVSVSLLFGNDVQLDLPPDGVHSEQPDGTVLILVPDYTSPREKGASLTRIRLNIEGFVSATEAEAFGLRAATAILWAAISKKFGLRVEYSGSIPASVYERNRSAGISLRGEGRVYWDLRPEKIFDLVRQVIGTSLDRPGLVTSIELFAASQLEATVLARFVMMVTSLEALAVQEDYGEGVETLVSELVKTINASTDITDARIRDSLVGRTRELRRESIRQAILRTVRTHLGDEDAVAFVDRAYGVRSTALHTGVRAPDLETIANEFEAVMRRIYQAIFGLALETPASSPAVV